ncbi:polyisoprenyl-teichoic acid--peptidoglycan teichoic acid transferase TagU [Sutcliffiella rhizosphaerae]|uniref:Polyisoprenyl-teichoic acid--peptidoglycan teichoic acid transferase TagU n=1 Tax=Sutcliffiella rhizosphaerae TaxID=2880967 RepID=A0ABM8YN48_9BACI|nr:LytR family transcriptional regulator [Sutcliffiella rhizosphaerae]CAG9621391.1 Polyisoprenyl-teichoic acid--peptidoglycan teichoic acid transferase TagU [Sutcliffiella rhizosphaerae]
MFKKKWFVILISVLGIATIGVGIFTFTVYKSLQNTAASMHTPLERDNPRTTEIDFKNQDPLSFLILGVDERPGDKGRSDSMIVMTVNPNKKSINMVSIPRDTRTEIIGRGFDDKINHAYAFGGPEMSIATVENFLDIPIDYYIQVNMESFKEVVDTVGGITVNNKLEFSQDGHNFPLGEIQLNGDKALSYSRMRKLDSDFGRQQRQRDVIQGVISKGASISSVTKFDDILDVLGNNVRTNLTFNEMIDIQSNYKEARHNLAQHQIIGTDARIDNIYYLIVSEEDRLTLSSELRQHLELDSDVAQN